MYDKNPPENGGFVSNLNPDENFRRDSFVFGMSGTPSPTGFTVILSVWFDVALIIPF